MRNAAFKRTLLNSTFVVLLLLGMALRAEVRMDNLNFIETQATPGQQISIQWMYFGSSYYASAYFHIYLCDTNGNLAYYIGRRDIYMEGGSGLRYPPSGIQQMSFRLPADIDQRGNWSMRCYSSLGPTPPHLQGGTYYTVRDSLDEIFITSRPDLVATGFSLSAQPGSSQSITNFTTSDTIYVSFYLANQGLERAMESFYYRIMLDGQVAKQWIQNGLNPKTALSVTDVPLGILHSGQHQIGLVVDPVNTAPESDEFNNDAYALVQVRCGVDLALVQPAGWDGAVVLSAHSGIYTNASRLLDTNFLFLSFAITNRGDVAALPFSVSVYVDGVLIDVFRQTNFTFPGALPIGVEDYPLGTFSAGSHTVEVRLDSGYELEELRETNNNGIRSFVVEPANRPPVANADTFDVDEDSEHQPFPVLTNDTTLPDEGEVLQITSVSSPAHGSAQVASNQTEIVYTPNLHYIGPDTFTYAITDGHGGFATATVSVNVVAINHPPVAKSSLPAMAFEEGEKVTCFLQNDQFEDREDGTNLVLTARLANGDPLPPFIAFTEHQFVIGPALWDVGSYSVLITATDSGTPPKNASVFWELTVTPRSEYRSWVLSSFPETELMDPAREFSVWGEGADPDGDGLPNQAEFLFGRKPLLSDNTDLLQYASIPGASQKLILSFSYRTNCPGLEVSLQSSHDLLHWSKVDPTRMTSSETTNGFRASTLTEPMNTPTSFYRLECTSK